MKEEKCQGKMICNRWEDVHLEQRDCFALLSCWKAAPMHMVVGIQELYQQLLPTKVFSYRKVETSGSGGKGVECVERQQRVSHISYVGVGH